MSGWPISDAFYRQLRCLSVSDHCGYALFSRLAADENPPELGTPGLMKPLLRNKLPGIRLMRWSNDGKHNGSHPNLFARPALYPLERLVPRDFKGVLQCDGSSAYAAFKKGRNAIELAACWAHTRRKFHEALEQAPRRAGWILRQIQHLYRIESALRETKAGPKLRAAVRAQQSRPILDRIKKALLQFKAGRQHLPQSLLGRAVDYALGQWTGLEVFLREGRVEMDNNLVENAIRPTAVGKKNWLFMGEAGAGQRGAIIYTVIESCRRRGVDPYAYLQDLLTRLPTLKNTQISEVTPAA